MLFSIASFMGVVSTLIVPILLVFIAQVLICKWMDKCAKVLPGLCGIYVVVKMVRFFSMYWFMMTGNIGALIYGIALIIPYGCPLFLTILVYKHFVKK